MREDKEENDNAYTMTQHSNIKREHRWKGAGVRETDRYAMDSCCFAFTSRNRALTTTTRQIGQFHATVSTILSFLANFLLTKFIDSVLLPTVKRNDTREVLYEQGNDNVYTTT